MRVIVVATAEGAVVNIQTFGAICEGILISEVFLICDEHLVEILAVFLVYKAVMHDSGFASGWNGEGMLQNWPFASWQILNWWGEISTAMVSSLCNPKIVSVDVIAGCKITMGNIQSEYFVDGKLLWLILNWYIYKE